MDSLKSNIEEIPKEITNETLNGEANRTPPTETANNENTIATAATEIATTNIENTNQETDLAAMSKDLEESLIQPIQLENNTTTNSSLSELTTVPTISNNATNTAVATNSNETNETATNKSSNSNQFVTPQKPDNKSIQLHASTSLKKKRNKFTRCLSGNNDDGVCNINGGVNVVNNDDVHDSASSLSNVLNTSSIKTSLSMTSLPPDEKQENHDGIKAKLKVERPYNSLKKNTDRNLTNQLANMHSSRNNTSNSSSCNNKYNRYSWGSGHSSSSLHSSAATLGIGSGKDDLWAAIQTNYNYIMDTNLLDTCKEARCEIEGATNVLDNTMDKSFKLLDDNNRNVGSCEDPKELRKWLRDMEHKLENAPTLSEATMLTCAELEIHLNEHSVLYHEIVSHARIVSACIRAASEKEQKQQLQLQQQHQQQQQLQHDSDASLIAEQTNSSLSSTDDTTTATTTTTATNTTTATTSGVVCITASTSSSVLSDHQISPNSVVASVGSTSSGHSFKKSDLERLQNRYHLLYLKAFEVQLWLDGLLRKKSSSVGNLTNEDLDSEDIDDSIDYSDDCCLVDDEDEDDDIEHLPNDEDGATEDDLNDVASDLESDITHNSLSYNEDNYNNQQQQHQQHQKQQKHSLQQHLKKQQKQQLKHQHCHSSDIDENQTINVSSHQHHQQQQQQQQQQHLQNLQTSSRDCIQNKIDCEDRNNENDDLEDEGDNVEIEEEAEDGDDEDEIDSPNHKNQLGYTKLLVTFDRSSGRSSAAAQHKVTATLTDFEADSESSDLETIQRGIRNQRNAGKNYKLLNQSSNINSNLIAVHNPKRSTNCITLENLAGFNNANKTNELESCDIEDMQTLAATSTITETLLNDHLQHKQHQQQRVTLMAITQNTTTAGNMTTGCSTATSSATQSLGSTVAATSTTNNNNNSNNCNTTAVVIVAGHKDSNCNNSNSGSGSDNNSDSMSNSSLNAVNVANTNANNKTNIFLVDNENNQQHHLKHQQQHNGAMKQKNIAIISPNSHKNYHHHHHHSNNKHSHNKSPTVLRKHLEHHSDISKFNRSNRKSKNCAIFYFKHLDTDNETNYSNSNCDDDGHDDVHLMAGNGDGGGGVDDVGEDNIVGGLLSSSAASSSHASDLLKSADVSSDDEGWLYTSAPTNQQQQQHTLGGDIESLNSNHISSSRIELQQQQQRHPIDSGIQSSTVSSSTANPTSIVVTNATTTLQAATLRATASSSLLGDDSDKENKEAKASTSTNSCTSSLTQIRLTTPQTFAASTTVVDSGSDTNSCSNNNSAICTAAIAIANSNNSQVAGSSSSSSITSSSYSSNDRLTEATTTTSTKTITTQILKYPQQQHPHYRSEMELQINNNNNQESSQITMKENILNNNNNNMPHLVNNCANSLTPSSTTNSPTQKTSAATCSSLVLNCAAAGDNNDVNGNFEKENIRFYTRADICNISVRTPNQYNDNNNLQLVNYNNGSPIAAPSSSSSFTTTTSPLYSGGGQHLLHVNVGKRLPPRSPAKSSLSHTSTNTSTSTISPTKGKVSHESIKQLVLEAEHLVRDEALKTPTKQKHSSSNNNNNNNIKCAGGVNIVQISTTVKKREVIMPGPIKQRVQEWLEHQPSTAQQLQKSISHDEQQQPHHRHLLITNNSTNNPIRTDDCEASGEASETDSIPQHCSDTSEVSDSIATCMQTSTNSYGNSTERIGGSAEPIVNAATSNQSLNVKVIKRQQNRRKSERPWSVSCLSQLTTDANQVASKVNTISNVQSGLASHSISESALDSLSPGRPRASSSSAVNQVKSYDSKGSLKRRKTRKKKLSYNNGKKSDTNSEDNNHPHYHNHHHNNHYSYLPSAHQEELEISADTPKHTSNLLMQTCENMTPQQIQEIQQALMQLQNPDAVTDPLNQNHLTLAQNGVTNESEEENHLMKPNFRVGSYTTAYMTSEARLGSLAALATYRNDEDQQGEYNTTGTEDHHSSFSETAWDNYQEKYNSENYSEGFDSDAARKLLEFGDDYRNFIDSQSDCCSSLSAANNLDSFSPPRMDSLQQNESKIITQDTIVSSVDHARRRRALELEYERRRKNLEIRRKSCQESLEYHNPKSPVVTLSSSTQALTPKNSDRFNFQPKTETATRKLEFGMSHSAQSLRRTSESDTSQRRRKVDERRRSSRNLEKCIKLIPATSSSSGDDTDDEKEIRNLLQQSHNRLEDTKALKIRCHLLRPEDYTEIINTCRDNIRCLESVLKGPTSSVLSSQCVTQSKDLLAAWEDLLGWSENAAAARKMQEDMIVLKHALNRLGNKSSFELLDTEPSIQIAIEALKNEKTQLQTYRTSMLKLNASVHSWLTRQERRLQNALVEQQLNEAAAKVSNELLLEEKDELESEHNKLLQQQIVDSSTSATTATVALAVAAGAIKTETTTTTTMITVTDSNGNQVESHTTATSTGTTATNTVATSTTLQQHQQQQHGQLMQSSSSCSGSEKNWDLQTLITSETEFHKHLKDEVSDMYTAWDEADARINSQLEVLTSSLIAWRQLECGLSEFQLALGQDRGTLKGLEGALNTGQATPGELAQNVKLVAKLLSEKVNVSQEQLTAVQDYLDPNHILHIAKFTASNGSLSDSGISDGGTTSDGGLSERERRLGVLRRLAKQLESALAPGSEAMKSIAARMESAENELKSLQNTCRDLIVRTAASHQNKKQQQQQQQQKEALATEKAEEMQQLQQENGTKKLANGSLKMQYETNGKLKQLTQEQTAANGNGYGKQTSNKRNRRRNRRNSHNGNNAVVAADMSQTNALQMTSTAAGDGGDDPSDDPSLAYDLDTSDDELTPKSKRGWGWRIARIAVPMQLALFAVYCAANLMQPNCCDNINNFSMSFTPQLRYIRGPPPI